MGILETADPESHCLWFKRTIKGIEDLKPETIVSHYIGIICYVDQCL